MIENIEKNKTIEYKLNRKKDNILLYLKLKYNVIDEYIIIKEIKIKTIIIIIIYFTYFLFIY
jgi:hypothetical protein